MDENYEEINEPVERRCPKCDIRMSNGVCPQCGITKEKIEEDEDDIYDRRERR